MGALSEEEPAEVYGLLQKMNELGYLTTKGLVENVSVSEPRSLPMIGALNAGFETLGAYHLQARHRKSPDVIYDAARTCPEIRQAMKLFYPQG
jgi:hypothetical protein